MLCKIRIKISPPNKCNVKIFSLQQQENSDYPHMVESKKKKHPPHIPKYPLTFCGISKEIKFFFVVVEKVTATISSNSCLMKWAILCAFIIIITWNFERKEEKKNQRKMRIFFLFERAKKNRNKKKSIYQGFESRKRLNWYIKTSQRLFFVYLVWSL